MRIFRTAVTLFILALTPGLAAAQEAAPGCRDDDGVDRCAAEQQQRVLALFGVRSIEEHRAAGDQVRRVFYVDGYGRDLILISFVRARGRDPTLGVHYPQPDGEPGPEPMHAAVPQEVWTNMLLRSSFFERDFAPVAGSGLPRVCMHAWVYTIEATDPARSSGEEATLRRATKDACADSPAALYATEAEGMALPLFPHCARLDPHQHRNPSSQLAACRILYGDRMAAAEVLNLAGVFQRVSTDEEAGLMFGRFDYDAVVDWNGARNEGRGSALAFWVRKVAEEGRPSFFVQSVHGQSADRVRLVAMLSRSVQVAEGAEARYERAHVEQVWAWQSYGEFAVVSATVGPWVPHPTG